MVITGSEDVLEAGWRASRSKYMILRPAEASPWGSRTSSRHRGPLWAALTSDLTSTSIRTLSLTWFHPLFSFSASRTLTTSSRLLTSTTRQQLKQRRASGNDFNTFVTALESLWQHPLLNELQSLHVLVPNLEWDYCRSDGRWLINSVLFLTVVLTSLFFINTSFCSTWLSRCIKMWNASTTIPETEQEPFTACSLCCQQQ